ncbi:MAG TPA: hypothetical protein PK544_11660 [Spirochaetota bacterium]|nr:hypothetical protein [Spirochaetota bacterium]HPJ38908.1 hypothetical protein [Spirochaetota bacterium]HPQ54310.1 hypothetical protein [Spirochaetota bacterium]
MKIKMFAVITGAVLAISFTASAFAQNNCPRGKRMNRPNCQQHLRGMDTNNDGKVSRDEWNAFHQKMFQNKDANNDGFLTQDELRTRQGMNRRGR